MRMLIVGVLLSLGSALTSPYLYGDDCDTGG